MGISSRGILESGIQEITDCMQSIHKQDLRDQVNGICACTTGCRTPGFETMQTFHYLETALPLLNPGPEPLYNKIDDQWYTARHGSCHA